MRVALIGASHWHLRFFLPDLTTIPGVTMVGVSDPDIGIADAVAGRSGCKAWPDYRDMCEQARPDFVVALGRHNAMAETAHFLLDAGIPFLMEKPCAIDMKEMLDIVRHARESGVFASACLPMRSSPMLGLIEEFAAGKARHYLAFKFVGGTLDRYAAMQADWVLQRKYSGGGALLNLGVHCLDLACLMLPGTVEVTAASLSNSLGGYDVEDQATVLLRAGSASAYVETGYLYPKGRSVFDQHFSFRTQDHYFVVENDHSIEISDASGNWIKRDVPTTNSACYPIFLRETLRRVERGEPPIADMSDMARALALIHTAYDLSPLPNVSQTRN